MLRVRLFVFVLVGGALSQNCLANRGPERTVESATQVLHEITTIPVRRIPESLLADAQGIAIIPEVIKVGFVGGIRRGRGVVMVRDRDGDWGLPQFVILTGGSVGWQAGIQSTDVVLVFRTRQSIDGLLKGKFTLGAGAAVAAGPVGRSAEAATDAALKAEILSYSRGRGIFAGVAIDGTAIEIDRESQQAYYGLPANAVPTVVPESAMRLLTEVASMTGGGTVTDPLPRAVDGPVPNAGGPNKAEELRGSLVDASGRLYAKLDPSWRQHLALPKEVFAGDKPPNLDSLKAALQRFDRIAGDPRYQTLSQQRDFQATHSDLRQYVELLTESTTTLDLPPPPADSPR
ncbi:MAG TPA: lipid-binding SYLF domain-containing protein [Pirellulales bacterium]|nr:lipid-binding SYLF domain-containing protein [Pirellulales bacterium]